MIDQLKEKYPLLYTHLKYIECEAGWSDLIDELSAKLEDLIKKYNNQKKGSPCYAVQVKEKFGGLRFYMSCETREMSKLIHEYEEKSYYICEICGKDGKIIPSRSWITTRCEEHVNR